MTYYGERLRYGILLIFFFFDKILELKINICKNSQNYYYYYYLRNLPLYVHFLIKKLEVMIYLEGKEGCKIFKQKMIL